MYTLILYLLLPYALLHLLWRGRKQRGYLQHVGERFGRFAEQMRQPVIWVHAVSVGETRAAEPLIAALRARHPDHRILLTHATPTGRETGAGLYGNEVSRCYLPYDFGWAVRRFLQHFKPQVGVVMETEIWPNLIEGCVRHGIPCYLVNARMSEKSARGYRRFGVLTRRALGALSGIGAQTARDAERLATLGAEGVVLTGNIKFDRAAPPDMQALGTELRALFGRERRLFLAASTREGEEALVLEALAQIGVAGLLTIIVPRHPQRFDDVAALLGQHGIRYARRSSNQPVAADVRVVLGDSMGEMFAYYAACDLAFVGGSLLPLGGQNLLEACAVGRPVLVGPHTFNFEDATEGAIQAGAALRIADTQQLAETATALLNDPARREAMADAGRQFAHAHRGATERTMEMLIW